ncbi:MAG: hypothetical protein R3190_01590, partial [Thermoanaerobaculia bacterium]|nr:hypothetical protein [Thermoanaerobaculia bacterium]
LFFGEPGHDYWGSRLSGSPPLYYSVYPGLLALALLGSLRRPREPVEKWGWALVAVGAFAALGGWNPLVFWILRLPAAASLRYPVKGLLLVAVGGALLCAVALERCRERRARVRVGKSLGVLAVLLALLLAVVSLRPDWIAGGALFPLEPTLATASLARWRALFVASLALAGGLAVLVLRIGRWRWATVALVALHVGSQALLLRPLADTDDAAAYRLPPPALDLLQPGDRVLQACALLAGCGPGRMEDLPDTGVRWLQRRAWTDLHPLGGAGFGVRYAFNTSPEGLDTLLPSATRSALDDLSDAQLLRLLAASSVDVLLLNRPIDPALADAVRLRGEVDTLGSRLWVYEVAGVAAEERLVAGVEGADLRSVLGRILADDFDPHGTVVLPGYRGPSSRGPNGRVEAVSSGRESWSWSVDSSDGGLLVLGRAYLSLYEARVDDVPAEPLAVNAGQLAIPVPPGRHRVDLAVDRTPFRRALVAAAAGLVLLVLVGRFAAAHGGRREARGRPRGASGGESPG